MQKKQNSLNSLWFPLDFMVMESHSGSFNIIHTACNCFLHTIIEQKVKFMLSKFTIKISSFGMSS